MTAVSTPLVALPPRPYPGIESFHYLDSPIFPGRDQESEKLLRLVTIYRGVLLYGASGSGKSSLINAGFIPKAMADGFTADRIRFQPRPGQEIIVERIAETPETTPRYLPSNFAGPGSTDARIVLSIGGFQSKLRDLPGSVYPLLIFDQFEELVSLFEEAPRGDDFRSALDVQDSILRLLAELVRDPTLRVKLVLAFREDYLAKLGKLFVLCPNLPDIYLRLTPLRTDALHDIIHGPFDRFPGHFLPELSADLADRLGAAIRERATSGFLNLSETQIACLQLWQASNPEEAFKTRGVQGLLEDYLSDALNRLPAVSQDPAVALLSCMVTDSGLRNVISREDLVGRVEQEDHFPEDRLEAALKALEEEKTRLIRHEHRHEVVFYEIISEFLVPWIARQKADRREKQRAAVQRRKWVTRAAIGAGIGMVIVIVVVFAAVFELRTRTIEAKKTWEVMNARRAADEAQRKRDQALEDVGRAQAELRDAKGLVERLKGPIPPVHLWPTKPVRRSQAGQAAYPLTESDMPTLRGATDPSERARGLIRIIEWLDVEHSLRYRISPDLDIYPHVYAYDYALRAGVYLPRVWWIPLDDIRRGSVPEVRYGETVRELQASEICGEWLGRYGGSFGWKRAASVTQLQALANEGKVGLICASNVDDNFSGGMAIIVPEHDGQVGVREGSDIRVPLQSSAGVTNHKYTTAGGEWWNGTQFRSFGFWYHE